MARDGEGDAFWVHQNVRLKPPMCPTQPEGGCLKLTRNQLHPPNVNFSGSECQLMERKRQHPIAIVTLHRAKNS